MRKHSFVVGAVLAACLAVSAWAHEGAVLDLEALETYVAQKEAETETGDKAVHKAWKQLDAKLSKETDGKLAKDLGKLAALSNAANGVLVADGELRTLLDAAIAEADQRLAAEPDREAETRDIVARAGALPAAADELKARVATGNPLADEEASLYRDVLGWALSVVAWIDVARAFGPGEDDEPTASPPTNTPL